MTKKLDTLIAMNYHPEQPLESENNMKPKWISINTEYPRIEGYYLVSLYNKKVTIRKFKQLHGDTNPAFMVNGGKDKKVTHWAELPESA